MGFALDISANVDSIPMLNGTNFKLWKEELLLVVGLLDLDIALRVPSPAPVTDTSSSDEIASMEKWEKSNRMCILIIKRTTPEAFRSTIPESMKTAKEFLEEIEKLFAETLKTKTAKICELLARLTSMRYTGKGDIREHIMEMYCLFSELTAIDQLGLADEFFVQFVLRSLPADFDQLKVSYNCLKETWSLGQLISQCVYVEELLKREKAENTHLSSTFRGKGKQKMRGWEVAVPPAQKKQNME